jgi:nucleoside-diphosphate-sugar epimerase
MNFTKKLKRKQKLIYASSSCVYVESGTVPKVESEMSPPSDGLTLSKTTLDNLMPLLDVEYYGLRFGSVNGWSPNMRTDLMINSMTLSALKNKKVNVFNAHAHRPIVSTHDLCRAVDAIINSGDKRGIYNVASFNLNIGDVGRKVADHLNVELVDKGVSQTYDFMISSDKFKNTFNFEFESTVESIVDSITSNPISETWGRRDAIS